MKNTREQAITILKDLRNGTHKQSQKLEDIITYANKKNISWMDNNSQLCQVLKFSKQAYRYFNDGAHLYILNRLGNELNIINEKLNLIDKVYNNIFKD